MAHFVGKQIANNKQFWIIDLRIIWKWIGYNVGIKCDKGCPILSQVEGVSTSGTELWRSQLCPISRPSPYTQGKGKVNPLLCITLFWNWEFPTNNYSKLLIVYNLLLFQWYNKMQTHSNLIRRDTTFVSLL